MDILVCKRQWFLNILSNPVFCSWIPTLSDSESEQSDSSYEVPQRRRNVRQTKGPRRKQQRGRPRLQSTSSDEYGGKKSRKKKNTAFVGSGSIRSAKNKVR